MQVTIGDLSRADEARKRQVDVPTIIAIRRAAKDTALAALAPMPNRRAKEHSCGIGAARAETDQLARAVTAQAIELAVVREDLVGAGGPASGAGPSRREGI